MINAEVIKANLDCRDVVEADLGKPKTRSNRYNVYQTMTKEWFGKNCKYLCGQWNHYDVNACQGDEEDLKRLHQTEPELVFCKHKDNHSEYEGNCNKRDCPILKEEKGETMNIIVRNKRTYKGPGERIDSSVLGNPYYMADESQHIEVIRKYKILLWRHIKINTPQIKKELNRLYKLAIEQEELNLICWCAPKACHGDVIKAYLEWRHKNAS